MEEKKSNKGLVVTVIILIVLLLGAVGYVCYDKFFSDGVKQVESESDVNVDTYNGYKVFSPENSQGEILTINVGNKWYAVGDNNNSKVVIGQIGGELYFAENIARENGFDTEFKSVNVDTRKENDYFQISNCSVLSGVIYNNKIYFATLEDLGSKIFSIDLNSTDSNEKVEILDLKHAPDSMNLHVIKVNDNDLYYSVRKMGSGNNEIKKMNLETKDVVSIGNAASYVLANNELITESLKEDGAGVELKKYNENTNKFDLIKKFDVINSFLKVDENDYSYYYINKDSDLIKYNDSKEEVLYKDLKQFAMDGDSDISIQNVFDNDIVDIDGIAIIKAGNAYTSEKDYEEIIPKITAVTSSGEKLVLSLSDAVLH